MAYPHLAPAIPEWITERTYAVAPVIRFAGIESCVAIVGKTPAGVIGIHLSIIDETPRLFDQATAQAVHAILFQHNAAQHGGRPIVAVVGDIDAWSIDPQVSNAYNGMLFGMAVVGAHSAKGDYGALMIDGGVTVTHGGVGLGWTV